MQSIHHMIGSYDPNPGLQMWEFTWGLETDFQPPNFTIEPTILTILFLNGTIQ